MSTEEGPVAWLRRVIAAELGHHRQVAGSDDAGGRAARCEAELAIIDRCRPLLEPDPDDLDEHYQDGRDDDEIMRDEALAGFADEILALLADGYRHREGWAVHWACPGCGKPVRDVPAGHSWAIPLTGGPWTCSDPKGPPVSPAEFTARTRRPAEPSSGG